MITELQIGYYMPAEDKRGGGYTDRIEVMAIAKGHAMWRRKGCMPAAHSIKSLCDMLNNLNAVKVKK